jgi:hypothetical protein
MRLLALRTATLAAALLAPLVAPVAATAAEGDTVEYIGRFYATNDAVGADPAAVTNLIAGTGVQGPQNCQADPFSYIYEVYADAYTRYPANPYEPPEFFYVWHADGYAQLQTLYCVRSSKVIATVEDVAPAGEPDKLSSSETGTGRWWAEATPDLHVREFEGTYARGRSTLRVELRGSWTYYVSDATTKTATATIPCQAKVWTVTPTPTKPVFDSGPWEVPCY